MYYGSYGSIDLYEMKKVDYYDGILHYKRQKTRTVRADEAYIEMKVPDMHTSTAKHSVLEEGITEKILLQSSIKIARFLGIACL